MKVDESVEISRYDLMIVILKQVVHSKNLKP
jgi:hypothetical protein